MASGKAAKWGLGTGKIIVIVISILVIAGVGLLMLGIGHGINRTLPQFTNSEQPAPSAFSNVYSSSGQEATDALASLSTSYLSNVSEFNISYSGNIDVSGSGPTSLLSVSSPISVVYSSYGPSRKFIMNISSVSVLGDATLAFVNLTNGTFTCSNFNSTALSYGNVEGAFFGNRSMVCSPGSAILGFDLSKLAYFNFTQLQDYGVKFYYTSNYQSVYRGMPCTYLGGDDYDIASNGTVTENGSFEECISDQYYVPLSLWMYASGSGGSFSVGLNETSVSNSSSQAYVTLLPGRVG